jgi:hypothetical protein
MIRIILYFLLSAFFISCSNEPQGRIVARYKDNSLSQSALLSMMPKDYALADSADIANSIITQWIEAEWMKEISKDASWTPENELQIEQYKLALQFQNWKDQWITEKLDTSVKSEEILLLRNQIGDTLNSITSGELKDMILQARKNQLLSDYQQQSIEDGKKAGLIMIGEQAK